MKKLPHLHLRPGNEAGMIGIVRSLSARRICKHSGTAARPTEYGQSVDWQNCPSCSDRLGFFCVGAQCERLGWSAGTGPVRYSRHSPAGFRRHGWAPEKVKLSSATFWNRREACGGCWYLNPAGYFGEFATDCASVLRKAYDRLLCTDSVKAKALSNGGFMPRSHHYRIG